MNDKPKICPDCGKEYTGGHACSIMGINTAFNLSEGRITLHRVIEADYNVETGEFLPKHLSDPIEIQGNIIFPISKWHTEEPIIFPDELPSVTVTSKSKPLCSFCDDKGYVERTGYGGSIDRFPCSNCDAGWKAYDDSD